MNKRLFTDWSIEPTDSLLRKQMGSAMNYYSAVLSKLESIESSGSLARETDGF